MTQEVKSVDDLFKPGMLLPVVIKEIIENKQNNKSIIKLSAVPSSVNASIPLKAVEDGMVSCMCVFVQETLLKCLSYASDSVI